MTFSRLKIVWSIVWCSRLLLRVATDLNKCVTTYFDVFGASKIFSDPQASRGVVQRSLVASNFASQRPKSLPKRKKSLSDHVFAIKNCVVRRLITPLRSKRAQGPKQVPNNLFWCSYCPRKVFVHPQTKSVNFKIMIFEQFLIKFDFWRALECLKPQKSASCGRTKTFLGQ